MDENESVNVNANAFEKAAVEIGCRVCLREKSALPWCLQERRRETTT